MGLARIGAQNFKSFDELSVDLGSLSVIVGANASGKSNFIAVLRFLRDIAEFGVQNAVSMHGGPEYLPNLASPKNDVVVEFAADLEFEFPLSRQPRMTWATASRVSYELRLTPRRSDLIVAGESITISGRVGEDHSPAEQKNLFPSTPSGAGDKFSLMIGSLNGELKTDSIVPAGLQVEWDFFYPDTGKRSQQRSLLEEDTYFYYPLLRPIQQFLKNTRIYDIDPKAPKRASPITGRSELEENGGNLAVAIQRIIRSNRNRKKFVNLTHDILPFIRGFSVDRLADKSVLAQLEEKYTKNYSLPASFISDGTVAITALIIALYFEEQPLIVVEEPERNIHPFLLSRLVGMIEDASRNKQIIVTTHNPQLLRRVGLESVLLMSRGASGFSQVRRPSEIDAVRAFLDTELGLDDLFVNNMFDL